MGAPLLKISMGSLTFCSQMPLGFQVIRQAFGVFLPYFDEILSRAHRGTGKNCSATVVVPVGQRAIALEPLVPLDHRSRLLNKARIKAD